MRLTAPIALLACVACSSPLELSVDVRSDYAPGLEARGLDVTLERVQGGEPETAHLTLGRADDLYRGVRALDADGLSPGDYRVHVSLSGPAGELARRDRAVTLEGDLALTLVLGRSCEGVSCAAGTTCALGACVDPSCGPEADPPCPAPACATAADCPPRDGCLVPACALRQCLYLLDEVCAPEDGGVDAGPDAGLPDAGGGDGGCGPEICDNGLDDDCDLQPDCMDPDCDGATCAGDGDDCTDDVCMAGACAHPGRPDGASLGGTMRCCGGMATDVATDRNNCGACGLACSGAFECTSSFGHPTCDCMDLNTQCHDAMGWVCSTSYFVCACEVGMGGCPAGATCVDDPSGPNYCEYR